MMMTLTQKFFTSFALFVVFMFGLGLPNVHAAMEIVAKVNGKAITNYDVDQRTAFLRMVTNLEDTKANRLQIRQDAIQMLIDEILKLDAAIAVDPTIAERNREKAQSLLNENFAEMGKWFA